MVTIRTGGVGISYKDERLKSVSEILNKIPFKNCILRIHDHKGILNILWNTKPAEQEKEIVNGVWYLFCEHRTEHKTMPE